VLCGLALLGLAALLDAAQLLGRGIGHEATSTRAGLRVAAQRGEKEEAAT
jgi:hypothetical protein